MIHFYLCITSFPSSAQGASNAKAALDWVFQEFPSPEQVLVTGWGDGSYGATTWAMHVSKNYEKVSPAPRVVLLTDSAVDLTPKAEQIMGEL